MKRERSGKKERDPWSVSGLPVEDVKEEEEHRDIRYLGVQEWFSKRLGIAEEVELVGVEIE